MQLSQRERTGLPGGLLAWRVVPVIRSCQSPGHPEFSKSYSEMAGEAFAITSTNGVPAQRFAVAAADQWYKSAPGSVIRSCAGANAGAGLGHGQLLRAHIHSYTRTLAYVCMTPKRCPGGHQHDCSAAWAAGNHSMHVTPCMSSTRPESH